MFQGFLALLASAIIYSLFSVFIRLLGQDLSVSQQIGFRNSIALVIALVVVWASKQSFASIRQAQPLTLVSYILAFPIAVVLYTFAVLEIKIMTAIFWLYLSSLTTSLAIGLSYFKEKFTLQKGLSLLLVVIGLVTYVYPFSNQFLSGGVILAILSGVFDAVANAFKKFFSGKIDRFVLVVLQMMGGLILAVVFGLAQGFTLPNISAQTWMVGVIFGICLVLVSYLTLFGFSHFDLNLGTVVLASEIFFATLLGWFIYQESASMTELIGGSLIFLATIVAQTTSFSLNHQWKRLTHLWRSRLASD